MTHSRWMAAVALATALMLPLAAGAQEKKGQPAAAPARPAVATPRVAAPPVAAPRIVPHVAAPHIAVPRRAAVPHVAAPRHAAVPHVTPRREVQHIAPRNAAVPHAATAATPNRVVHAPQPNAAAAQAHSAAPAAQAPPAAQRRADRIERLRERHVLRSLPANQRAAKREEFRQQHLNAQTNVQAQPSAAAQPNAAVQPNALARRRNARRNHGAAVTAQAAQQGRFAARFAARTRSANAAADPAAARRAWHRHHRAAFVAWYGPVFWPYAYSDIFDYAFWPDGYDEGYWDYAFDDFFDSLFWGEQGPPEAYAYSAPAAANARVSYAGVEELCKQPGTGITAWPFTEIERKVGLDGQQKELLADVRAASKKAAATFKDSCPSDASFPLTPPGRLMSMSARLGATLEAVRTVKPALDAFYNSLSDEQKERFNELGPSTQVAGAGAETTGSTTPAPESCKQPKPGLANLPIDKIEDVVQPTEAQEAKLNDLQTATDKAVSIMQDACPDVTPLTPTGRLEATELRLQAMIEAANTVKPALDSFYGSLSNEQKARFNRIGQELAQSND